MKHKCPLCPEEFDTTIDLVHHAGDKHNLNLYKDDRKSAWSKDSGMMEIIVEFEIYSGVSYFIQYEYWINGKLWIDPQNFATLWKKEGGHYRKVHSEW